MHPAGHWVAPAEWSKGDAPEVMANAIENDASTGFNTDNLMPLARMVEVWNYCGIESPSVMQMLLQWYFNTNGGLGWRSARFLLVQPRTRNFWYSHDGIYGLLWENPFFPGEQENS